MPPKAFQDTTIPEAQGVTYDESEMAYFHAKLLYQATFDERTSSHDNNLASVSDAQGRLLKRWGMLRDAQKEMIDKGETLSPFDQKQLTLCAWRYQELEKLATKPGG